MKMQKSWIAGILFGIAMGTSFCVMLGTPGLVLTAPFMFLGRIMFKELDTPKDQNVHDAPQKKQ